MVRDNPGFVYIAEAASAYVFVRKHYQPHEICELNEILLRDETTAYTMVSKTSSFAELIRYKFVNWGMMINQAINKTFSLAVKCAYWKLESITSTLTTGYAANCIATRAI